MRLLILVVSIFLSFSATAESKVVHGEFLGAKFVEELPEWFKASFLDLSEDLAEASDEDRHMMVYFHQDGCPYCAKLVEDNFHNPALVDKLKANFDVIETNMWGDRIIVDLSGKEFTEKNFAAHMKVQFTPTLVFLDAKGNVVLRLNGYQSIDKMHATLDYIANKTYLQQSYASYLNQLKQDKSGLLNAHAIFEAGPHMLARSRQLPAAKYLAVFFEEPNCPDCDNFYQELMPLAKTQELLGNMQVVRFNALSEEKLITPSGERTTAKDWYEQLQLTHKPAVVFFDKDGTEIIRKDAYFKQYHWHGIMQYVLSEAYQAQPSFQRYLEDASDKLREQGITVDLWQ